MADLSEKGGWSAESSWVYTHWQDICQSRLTKKEFFLMHFGVWVRDYAIINFGQKGVVSEGEVEKPNRLVRNTRGGQTLALVNGGAVFKLKFKIGDS